MKNVWKGEKNLRQKWQSKVNILNDIRFFVLLFNHTSQNFHVVHSYQRVEFLIFHHNVIEILKLLPLLSMSLRDIMHNRNVVNWWWCARCDTSQIDKVSFLNWKAIDKVLFFSSFLMNESF
jgi:hypothetical protein